ncbi:MAG TPA: DUF5011 domain-containing protein, partial [Candidatus Nitrosotenuis sp.]
TIPDDVALGSGSLSYPSSVSTYLISSQDTLTIDAGDTLTIPSGKLITNSGTLTNSGTIANAGTLTLTGTAFPGGVITNSGIMTNNGAINIDRFSRITNSGTIDNFDTIENSGIITNLGTLANSGTVANLGTINNSNTITNSNAIENSGTIANAGFITITSSGTLTNSGFIGNLNFARITNSGTIDNFDTITNSGTIENLGIITNQCDATYSGNPPSGNAVDNISCDTSPPVIVILGDNPATHEAVTPYVDAGATALDDVDGDLTSAIIVTNNVNENTPGPYTVEYSVTDSSGNTASAQRTVNVMDTMPPAVTISENITAEATGPDGATVSYDFPTATDAVDDSPTVQCTPASGSVFALGDTTVSCIATDFSGNSADTSFTVTVQDTTPPEITILGENPATILENLAYADAGATASDIVDGDLTASIITDNPVDISVPDTYTVTYTVSDNAGNTSVAERTVIVKPIEEATDDLGDQVGSLGLPKGAATSLASNLDSAISILSDNNPNNDSAACGMLGSFVNKVQAQSGKTIDSADADSLIADAELIRTALGC